MIAADLPTISAISDAVHQAYLESIATYAERLALYPAGCRTLWISDAIAGYIISHPWYRDRSPALNARLGAIPQDADTYYLHDIALLPSARGTGAGKAATEAVMHQAEIAGFDDVTLVAVNGADTFWGSQGFSVDPSGTPSPYGPGTLVMRRPITAR